MLQSEMSLRSQMQGYRLWKDTPEKDREKKGFTDRYKDIHKLPDWARRCALGKPGSAKDFYNYMKEYCNYRGG